MALLAYDVSPHRIFLHEARKFADYSEFTTMKLQYALKSSMRHHTTRNNLKNTNKAYTGYITTKLRKKENEHIKINKLLLLKKRHTSGFY